MQEIFSKLLFEKQIKRGTIIQGTTEYNGTIHADFFSRNSVTTELNVASSVVNGITEYRILLLSGETATTTACWMLNIFITDALRVDVAVAVRAITFTPGGRRLRISPSLANSLLNVSPL